MTAYLLTLSCHDGPGIVAAVSSHLFQAGGNILESSQYNDPELNRFFLRITFALAGGRNVDLLRSGMDALAQQYGMERTLRATFDELLDHRVGGVPELVRRSLLHDRALVHDEDQTRVTDR